MSRVQRFYSVVSGDVDGLDCLFGESLYGSDEAFLPLGWFHPTLAFLPAHSDRLGSVGYIGSLDLRPDV